MGLGGRALQPLGRLTKSTHAGSWSYRSSPPSRLASRHHDDTDPGFGLVARKCQLYRRLYMRTDPVQDGCHVTRQPGSDTVRTKDRLRYVEYPIVLCRDDPSGGVAVFDKGRDDGLWFVLKSSPDDDPYRGSA